MPPKKKQDPAEIQQKKEDKKAEDKRKREQKKETDKKNNDEKNKQEKGPTESPAKRPRLNPETMDEGAAAANLCLTLSLTEPRV
jgi:hypothetical protein